MKNIYIFLIGLFSITELVIGGFRAPVAIVLLVFLIPFIPYRNSFENKYCKKVIILLILWLLAIIISDIYNNTAFSLFLKDFARAFLLLLYFFIAYWFLKDRPQRILFFVLGSGLSGILQFFIFPSADIGESVLAIGVDENIENKIAWFVKPLIIALASIAYYYNHRYIAMIIIQFFAFWALYNNSRYPFMTMTVTTVLLLYIGSIKQDNIEKKYKLLKKNGYKYLFLILAAFLISIYLYSYLAENGFLGENAQKKYIVQKYGTDLGLASGRIDFFMSLSAIKENPIIGYGSFPDDKNNIVANFLAELGVEGDSEKIPSHSHLLGAWVFSGILGALFWIYIVYLLVIYIKKTLFLYPRFIAFSLLFFFEYVWDILFSPFSGARALRLAFILAYMLIVLNYEQVKPK